MRLWAALAFAAALAAAEPKVDLNKATEAQLAALPGVGPATAKRIVRIRERNGPYRCVEELRAVPRVTDGQFHVLGESVYVTGGSVCKQRRAHEGARGGR